MTRTTGLEGLSGRRGTVAPGVRLLALAFGIAVGLGALPVRPAAAQHTASQVVQLSVRPVSRISVSGNPGPLSIDRVEPDQTVASITDRSTTYRLLTNRDVRITAALDQGLPEGTRLEVGLESSLGASAGMVSLGEASHAVDLVAGARSGRETGGRITYTFSADLERDGFFEPETRTIVFTVLEQQ